MANIPTFPDTLSEHIREMRSRRGLTLAQLSRRSGVSIPTISQRETAHSAFSDQTLAIHLSCLEPTREERQHAWTLHFSVQHPYDDAVRLACAKVGEVAA